MTGNLPLNAIDQPQKDKVRPVMDYRQLNEKIVSVPCIDPVICDKKIRKWQKIGTNATIIDLKKAYLQINMHKSFQKF